MDDMAIRGREGDTPAPAVATDTVPSRPGFGVDPASIVVGNGHADQGSANGHEAQRDGNTGLAPAPIAAGQPELSVIAPTKNEGGNVRELVRRVQEAVRGIAAEMVFVDDSTDWTQKVIRELRQEKTFAIRLVQGNGGGLGEAVKEGFSAARGRWVCVIDADLQHPPEAIPQMLEVARSSASDVVIGSRYLNAGRVLGLEKGRSAVSKACIAAARLFFPALRKVSDPLSGFFLLRAGAVDTARLQPRGFKILLEILVRFPHLLVSELPFDFTRRYSGQSKASLREGVRYLRLLVDLRLSRSGALGLKFALVGASGLVVNQLAMAAFTDLAGVYYVLSAALATLVSTTWNFSGNEVWVFRGRSAARSRPARFGQFLTMNIGLLLLRGPFLVLLTSGFGVHYLVSNLLTLVSFTAARFIFSDGVIWSEQPQEARTRGTGAGARTSDDTARGGPRHYYDVHGILAISSRASLPELEYFRTAQLMREPDLRIEVGSKRHPRHEIDERVFEFREVFGKWGFWIEVTQGATVRIRSSSLLKFSPHVLYTNVVEPVVRWMLVQRGYALVHAACLVRGGKATLITARTDTGKTTTILKTLAQNGHGLSFLSDDMSIIGRDGSVLTYPKPLTISRHTLQAVNTARLSRWQRLILQLQSRVHSKSGRRSALTLAKLPLPMATINAIVQILIPPPKYYVHQLVPGVSISPGAKTERLMIIEVGEEDTVLHLEADQALSILLRNCEDAYGFPPYQDIAGFLYRRGGSDLRETEREIIGEGTRNCENILVRRRRRDWWRHLAEILDRESITASSIEEDRL